MTTALLATLLMVSRSGTDWVADSTLRMAGVEWKVRRAAV
jgi:hypothetical protein